MITLNTPDGTRYMTGGDDAMMSKAVRTAIGMMSRKGATEFNLDSEEWAQVQQRLYHYRFSSELPVSRPAGVRMASDAQRAYLVRLGVRLEPNMTMARASELIDAAKEHYLGSVGGFYQDGSN